MVNLRLWCFLHARALVSVPRRVAAPSGQALLEPVISVRFRVERRNFFVSRASIETNCLRERPVRLEPKRGESELHRLRLEGGQHSAAESETQRSEEHTSELQSHSDLVCRLLLEKKKEWPSFSRATARSKFAPRTPAGTESLVQ